MSLPDFNQKRPDLSVLDMLIFEARVAGVEFYNVYDFTFGELLEQVKVYNEIRRRKNKDSSVIAHNQAFLICGLMSEGGSHQVYEIFPYWTDKEISQMELDRLKNKMKEMVAKGR